MSKEIDLVPFALSDTGLAATQVAHCKMQLAALIALSPFFS